MNLSSNQLDILRALARYYVLTREQISRFIGCSCNQRTVRKRILGLRQAGLITNTMLPVSLFASHSSAPVYHLTNRGAELLATVTNDGAYLAASTQHPRLDRLHHWLALNETRFILEQATAKSDTVKLLRWINEWEVVNKSAAVDSQFVLRTQLSALPPLSCSPDAGFILESMGHRKVFYLEQDRGTSSPAQIAARKTKGYAELARQQGHRRHFPETTLPTFSVLFITTTRYRRDLAAKLIATQPGAELWRFVDGHDLSVEAVLHQPILIDTTMTAKPLVNQRVLCEAAHA